MSRKYAIIFLGVLVAVMLASNTYAGKGGGKGKSKRSPTPTITTFLENMSPDGSGLSGDGSDYVDAEGAVQSYIGVGGKDVDLVTYNSSRIINFAFADGDSDVWNRAALEQELQAEIDIFAINYWGRYMEMGVGTTAQVQSDFEFYVGRKTYELDYSTLAVFRETLDTWLITTDPNDIPGNPGFTASPLAELNVIRRSKQETFGVVSMPVRFRVRLKNP